MTSLSQEFIKLAILNPFQNEKCVELHEGTSCNMKMLHQFNATCKSLYKMYLLVHLIPFLLFKRKKLKQRPLQEIKSLIKGFLKSMLFAGGFTLITRRTMCFLTEHSQFTAFNGTIGAFLGGLSLNFEPIGRQSEIALFCVNKTMETLYSMALRRGYPVRIPYGECLLAGVAIGIICFHFVDCEDAIRDNYKKILEKVIGNM